MTAGPPAGIRIRPAAPADLPACGRIWAAGLDDYGARIGRPPVPAPPAAMQPMLEHFLGTDPARFLVAVRAGDGDMGPGATAGAGAEQVVGFVSALRRGDVWFLAMLFVDPAEQARGLGRALLGHVLPSAGDAVRRATCTDAAQPISNALYARHGIVPRLPVLELVGHADPARLPDLPEGVRAVPFELLRGSSAAARGEPAGHLAASLAALDAATLGYAHPEDHALLAAIGRLGYLYTLADGRAVAYGYAAPSGRIGPIAVEDEQLLPGILGHLRRAVPPIGASSVWITGAAGRGVTALLEAGLRIEDFPALLCWDRPFADFSRYVPITLAVL